MGNRWYRPVAIFWLVGGLLLGGCRATTTPPMIELTLDRPQGNTAAVTIEDGRALIDVNERHGINGVAARLTQGEWPPQIVVRLPLRGLEGLWIHYGDLTISTGVSSSGAPPPPLTITVVDEAGNVQSAPPSADIYYPDIRAVMPDGTAAVGPLAVGERPAFPLPEGSVFEITLPAHFFREAHDSFSMQWIDFYR